MNDLDKCVAEATAKGISYGQLMVDRQDNSMKAGEESAEKPKKEPVATLTCAYCGKKFPVYDRRKRRYCSDECAQHANAQKAKERFPVIAPHTATPLRCRVCGTPFTPTKEAHYVSSDGVKIYDTFDCPVCGCQIVGSERFARVNEEESHA